MLVPMSRTTDNQPDAPGRSAAATHHPRGTVRGDGLGGGPEAGSLFAPTFGGSTFSHARDGERLAGQLARVLEALSDGKPWTLEALVERCGGTTASVSSRCRDLRKAKFGGYRVRSTRVGRGAWVYRLIGGEA